MSDERYAWLDQEAAERILRGEPVEAADEHVRAQAERLSGALRGIVPVTYANDGEAGEATAGPVPGAGDAAELPGEAAALAAFRRAVVTSGDGSYGVPGGPAGTARPAGPERTRAASRLGRPVRRGLVAVVAGCSLGLTVVAVGAAAILPAPFVAEHGPLPSDSVPATRTPAPRPTAPAEAESAPPAPAGPARGPRGRGSALPSPAVPGEPDPDTGRGAAVEDDAAATEGATAVPGGAHGHDREQWYLRTLDDCRHFHDGDIDPERREALESAARGAPRVERFCEGFLGGGEPQGRGGDKGAPGGDGDQGGTDATEGGGHQGGDGHHGGGDSGDDGIGDGQSGGGGAGEASPDAPPPAGPPPSGGPVVPEPVLTTPAAPSP